MKPVLVTTVPSRTEAELVRSRLDADGIPAYIEADDAGGAYPFPLSGHGKGIRIFVRDNDLKNARRALGFFVGD